MFRKIAAVLASVVALAVSAGCATNGGGTTPVVVTPAQIAQFAANAQTKISAACTIAGPTIKNVSLMLTTVPTLQLVSDDIGLACAANAALDTTNVSNLVNSVIPAAITAVNGSSLDQSVKTSISGGLTLLGGAMSIALAEYNLSVATGTSTSLTSAVAPKVSVKLVTQ